MQWGGQQVTKIEGTAEGKKTLFFTRSGAEVALAGLDAVLFAVGRRPLTDINLAAAGVQLTAQGFIAVDPEQNTTAPAGGVYALGDVCGVAQLTPGAAPH